jgi:hypothetical protein
MRKVANDSLDLPMECFPVSGFTCAFPWHPSVFVCLYLFDNDRDKVLGTFAGCHPEPVERAVFGVFSALGAAMVVLWCFREV